MGSLGLERLSPGVFLFLATLWCGLFGLLTFGIYGLIWDVLWQVLPDRDKPSDVWDWRFRLVQLTALTTVLAGVVALPVTLQRLKLSNEQTQTAKASLFNEKITEAAADLHARRQFSKPNDKEKYETIWEDDVVRRNAAIDRLEGLVKEQPTEAERVCRLLCVYVRELSKEIKPENAPETDDPAELHRWARNLKIPRSDMENAVQVLGRLAKIDDVDASKFTIDLRHANLQAMSLDDANFEKALLSGADLQGANLKGADLQGADLRGADLQGANLIGADLQGADLEDAKLQGADLKGADLQGADLEDAKLQGADLKGADVQGVDLRGADLQGANLVGADLQGVDLEDAKLQGANLWDAKLKGANLVDADLQGADLRGADLQGADLIGADLQGADLLYAELKRADLEDAKLQGANLMHAKFDDATDLTEALFTAASVRVVDFTNVPQILAHLDQLFGNETTKLPEGTAYPAHWYQKDEALGDYDTQWRAFAATKGVEIPEDVTPF